MTTSAWIMLAATWSVVFFFTTKFYRMILRKPTGSAKKQVS